MELAYARERQQLVDKYLRLKPWYEGDLQRTIRAAKSDENPDPITNRAEWSGTEFWEQCFNAELNKLTTQYEKYIDPVDDGEVRYMWVGIDPDIKIYPDMLSLYKRLNELEKYSFLAVVEGHTEKGYRPHIHMILFTTIRPNRIIKNFSKFFKCKENFIEAKNNKKFYKEKLDYVNGKKTANKMKYVEADKKERKENNIPDIIDTT